MPKDFRIQTRYESEVKISLLLLVLFLFLMNFVSLFLFYNTQDYLHHEFRQKLSYLGNAIQGWFNSAPGLEQLAGQLKGLTSSDEVTRIDIYTRKGRLYFSSDTIISADSLDERIVSLSQTQKAVRASFLSEIHSHVSGQPVLDYYYPLSGPDQAEHFWAVIRVDARPLVSLEKSSRLTFWMLTIGFLAAFLTTIFLIRTALRPYRTIKKEALQANLLSTERTEPGADLVVETFKKTIAELKEKEKILQEMYQNSSRQASDLGRLNQYILTGMQSGVIICNPQGEITKVNPAALRILEFPENQLLGKKFFERFGENSPLAGLVQKALLERHTCLGQEIELISPRQKRKTLEVNTSLIEDEKGQLLGVTVLFTDLSQLFRLREELVLKEKMAALGEMSAGLAHQLRNSMGAIYGFANLLRKSLGEPNQLSQIIEEIGDETKSLEILMEKFLNFSKPLQLQREKLDLAYLIRESYQAVLKQKTSQPISFNLKVEEGLPKVWGDKLLLKQSLQNLFQNAWEAMPEGGRIEVQIKKSGRADRPEFVQIELTDTGIGMTDSELQKIFEPFYSTKAVGTGLGLSLARKIITLHEGRIEAESQKHQGSTFRIFLPAQPSRFTQEILAPKKV